MAVSTKRKKPTDNETLDDIRKKLGIAEPMPDLPEKPVEPFDVKLTITGETADFLREHQEAVRQVLYEALREYAIVRQNVGNFVARRYEEFNYDTKMEKMKEVAIYADVARALGKAFDS